MAATSPRRSTWSTALILGALLTLAIPPGIASAATTLTVRSPGATSGPGTANTESASNADCRTGGDTDDLVVGVGVAQTIGTGSAQSNLHVKGIVPFDGSAEYTADNSYSPGTVDTDATQARAVGATGNAMGGVDGGFGSTPYALCLDPNDAGVKITGTEIVMASASGPNGAGATALAVASCPEGTVLLGGGARTVPGTAGSLKVMASYPTYPDGGHSGGAIAAGDTDANPTAWAAIGLGGGMTGTHTTYAYAICGTGEDLDGVTVTVRYAQTTGPTSASAAQKTTAACGENDGTLISGGAGITGGDITADDYAAPGSQGDHLNGSYPSDAGGDPLTTSPARWTALTHTGGGGSTAATRSHAWALCLDGN